MELTGEYRIEAPRERVWAALNDPEILRQCIPGCESLERVSDTQMTTKTQTRVGPVKARFTGVVTLSDVNAPESCTLSGEGKGGAAGFAKGSARVHLAEAGAAATVLTCHVDAAVGGKLAQLGSRLVAGTARKLFDEFFSSFVAIVAPAAAEPAVGAVAAKAPEVPPAPAPPGLSPVVWIGATLVLVLVLILLFN